MTGAAGAADATTAAAIVELGRAQPDHGGKASNLGAMLRAGLAVPNGFVIPATAEAVSLDAAIRAAYEAMGAPPVAVRSSATGEDAATSSFAGQYETFLDVQGAEEVVAASERCRASAHSARVASYAHELGAEGGGVSVVVQRMVPARAAGVAFTADPVTGERDVVRVSAVAGVGETLVSGDRDAEEWTVRGSEAARQRGGADVLTPTEVLAIAQLAKQVEAIQGCAQDIEWAFEDDRLWLLQARPMTALPEAVTWESPLPGAAGARNFRLGEWIGEPVSPLFDTWLVTAMEERLAVILRDGLGYPTPEPAHVTVNGWYYYRLPPPLPPGLGPAVSCLARGLWAMATNFRWVAGISPPPLARYGQELHVGLWKEHYRPAYETAVAAALAELDTADPIRCARLVDELAEHAGTYLFSMIAVAGYAAKAELPLRRFFEKHLAGPVGGDSFELVRGLADGPAETAPHAVVALDWMFPTIGEEASATPPPPHARVRAEREAKQAECRAALEAKPRLLRRFDRLVAEAQAAHRNRLDQTAELTLGWPAMRGALRRIGEHLVTSGVLADQDDVYFLRRVEVETVLTAPADMRTEVLERRAAWQQARRLTPPLIVGELPAFWRRTFGVIGKILDQSDAPAGSLIGHPASPGRASGTARVIRGMDELPRLNAGEILIAPATTPGWTPAFARAAAVVTDTGSIASHASVVAREYGIPAVVATGDGTARIADGQRITVDGSRGWVETRP